MARYTASVCRLCRREGMKLFLKGSRCYSKKCAFERRPTPPGQHGVRRRKVGEYGMQLREKQKVRRVYAVLERQFKNYFDSAEALTNVVASGQVVSLQGGRRAVKTADWKAECVLLGLIDTEANAHSARTLFAKFRRELVAANRIACEGEFSWLRR